ncbi:hypothetical protein [Nitrobacter vulgaris]|uniref:hypothetical protein n=1 Tax=Nitrobacter vulgaris TaxID=29421 RepID=UPI001116D852|nr:hypothetical protein [Nitrobacter vulgaris]
MGEAFDLIALTPKIKLRADERVFARRSEIDDVINLETEDAMSEAGLNGRLEFRGLKAKHGKALIPVPPEWFGVRARRWVRTPRGIDPDSNELWFAPLHQEQDNSFVVAASFAAQNGVHPQRWFKVQVRTKTLETFLKTLDGAMPEATPKTPRPSTKIIKDAVASISASGAPVTAGRVIEKLQMLGYKPARGPIRDALKEAGLTRRVGRPSAAHNSPKS